MLGSPAQESVEVLVIEDLTQQRLPARTTVAALRQSGLTAQIIHFGQGSDPEAIVALTCSLQPRLIVLSLLFGHLWQENLRIAERLRAAGVTAHITVAGPLPAFAHKEVLVSCRALDSVLLGEPEASATRLAAALTSGADTASLIGLACRSDRSPAEQRDAPASDLDVLPFPARDDGIASHQSVGFATIESSRGCYHACSFCLPCAYYRDVVGVPYRLRSIRNLVAEIEWLYARGVRLFLFDDEQFLPSGKARAQRVTDLGTELRQRGFEIAFMIKCRPDDVEDGLFQQLKEMGLLRVYLGLESGCQTTLDILDKRTTVDHNSTALATLDRLGIVADFRCLIFHPWSTLDTLRTEVDYLQAMLPLVPTVLSFREVECFPGTAIYRRMIGDRSEDAARRPRASLGRAVPTWSYVLDDPRAEMLRRVSQRVFGRCLCGDGIVARTTEAWFAVLLSHRFRPGAGIRRQRDALRGIVYGANAEMLTVWHEMICFTEQTDPGDVDVPGRKESVWTERLGRLETRVCRQLDRLRSG